VCRPCRLQLDSTLFRTCHEIPVERGAVTYVNDGLDKFHRCAFQGSRFQVVSPCTPKKTRRILLSTAITREVCARELSRLPPVSRIIDIPKITSLLFYLSRMNRAPEYHCALRKAAIFECRGVPNSLRAILETVQGQLRWSTIVRYRVELPRQYRRFASLPDYYPLLWFLVQRAHKMGHSPFLSGSNSFSVARQGQVSLDAERPPDHACTYSLHGTGLL